MLKFFRGIRQKLVAEGNPRRYLLYAIGEILLVMIGILLALQVNNWNEKKREAVKVESFLHKLKDDIEGDMHFIRQRDTMFNYMESNSERAIAKFYQAKTKNDIFIADSLFSSLWNDLRINRSVYEEMLSTGSIYALKNKKLQYMLTNYYSFIESHQYYIKQVNENSTKLRNSENLLSFHLLLNSQTIDNLVDIDTNWIGDVNSTTYLALNKFYTYTQHNSNKYRRTIFGRVLTRSQALLDELEEELNQSN